MQERPYYKSSKNDVAIGALIGGGVFATALACGIITFPLAIPIGIVSVGVGAILFPTIKPTINKVFSDPMIKSPGYSCKYGSVTTNINAAWKRNT